MKNQEIGPRSVVSLIAGTALVFAVAGGAITYAYNGGVTGVNNDTPTPEQLQNETGRQVYIIPGEISDPDHGADLDDARDFCIRIGSGPNPDGPGSNPLPEYCNTQGLHDAYYGALSLSDLGQACLNANGSFRFVWVDGEFTDACLTDIPMEQG